MLTNAAACSQGKSLFIYMLFKDMKTLYLYNLQSSSRCTAHSLTNSYLPQPCFGRGRYMRPSRKTHCLASVCWQEGHATLFDDGRTANVERRIFFPHCHFDWTCVQEVAQDIQLSCAGSRTSQLLCVHSTHSFK